MLVDTNVVVFAINQLSPHHLHAQQFLQKNKKELLLAHQNVMEAIRVLTYPKFTFPMTTRNAYEAVMSIVASLRVVSTNMETYHAALALLKKYKLTSDRIFDMYLVATMISNGISTIATENERDFVLYKEIRVINPFRLGNGH